MNHLKNLKGSYVTGTKFFIGNSYGFNEPRSPFIFVWLTLKMHYVKAVMTRLNIDILGISKLRWTGMGEFNSDDHYIYYCVQES